MQMKPLITIIFLVCFIASCNTKPAQFEEKKLAALCRVWGFMKYNHPEVAKGAYNWDSVLLTQIPLIEKAVDWKEANILLLALVKSAGELQPCSNCQAGLMNTSFLKNYDEQWPGNELNLEAALKERLSFIRTNTKVDSFYYAYPSPQTGVAKFDREAVGDSSAFPQKKFRLLALFRYWNAVNYFFAYRYAMDYNWHRVLEESIPSFINAANAVEYNFALLRLSKNINDSHGIFESKTYDSIIGSKHPCFGLMWVEDKFVVNRFFSDSLHKLNEVQLGDIILSINQQPIEIIADSLRKYTRGSNYTVQNRNIHLLLMRSNHDSLKFSIERDGKMIHLTVPSYPIAQMDYALNPADTNPVYQVLPGNIGYVDMGELEERQVDSVKKTLSDTKAIIFDVRNYPKDVWRKLFAWVVPQQKRFVRFTVPNFSHPGVFTEDAETTDAFCGDRTSANNGYTGDVITLVNEITQSRAEFTVMALQMAPKATVIGSQTSGADGNETFITVPGNIKMHFTGLGVYYPNWKETQRIGIEPDVVVKPTLKGIRDGKDEVLQRAVQFIETGK